MLRIMAVGHGVNISKIVTWRGWASVSHVAVGRSGRKACERHSVVFTYDRELGATRWNWTCQEFRVAQEGVESSQPQFVKNTMLKGGARYEYSRPQRDSKKPRGLSITQADSRRTNNMTTDFDPLRYFRGGKCEMEKRLLFFADHAESAKLTTKVTRDGDRVTLDDRLGHAVNRYTMDLSQGCNVVAYHAHGSRFSADWQYDYERVDDVYVPKEVVIHIESADRKGRNSVVDRQVLFTKNLVNLPSDPGLFAIEQLGIRPGDGVYDERLGIAFRYGASSRILRELAAPAEGGGTDVTASLSTVALPGQGPGQRRIAGRTVTAVAAVVVVSLGFVALVRRRLRRGALTDGRKGA